MENENECGKDYFQQNPNNLEYGKEIPFYKKYPEIFLYLGTILGFSFISLINFLVYDMAINEDVNAEGPIPFLLAGIALISFLFGHFFIIIPSTSLYALMLRETNPVSSNTFRIRKKLFYSVFITSAILAFFSIEIPLNNIIFILIMISMSLLLTFPWVLNKLRKKYLYLGMPFAFVNTILSIYYVLFIDYPYVLHYAIIYGISSAAVMVESLVFFIAKRESYIV